MTRMLWALCFTMLFCAPAIWAQNKLVAGDDASKLTNVSFKEIYGKDAIANLARHLELKLQFDETLKSKKISFEMKDIRLTQALAITLVLQDWRARQLPDGVLLIIPDTEEARKRNAQYPDWSPNLSPR